MPDAAVSGESRGDRVYAMSREGKRQAFILLIGVASIWIFALWTLITILQDGITGVEWVSLLLMLGMLVVAPVVGWMLFEEANSRIATNEQGIRYTSAGGIDLTYKWSELSGPEASGRGRIARFFLGNDEDEISKTGVTVIEAGALRPGGEKITEDGKVEVADAASTANGLPVASGDDDEEPGTLLIQVPDKTAQIANPLTRFLHKQAHGAALPVFGKMERRAELINDIARHAPPVAAALGGPASSQPSVDVPPPTA